MTVDIEEKRAAVFGEEKRAPAIVLTTFGGEGERVYAEIKKITDRPFTLIAVGGIKWNDEMTPWAASPVYKGDSGYKGLADGFLQTLTDKIIPAALKTADISPSSVAIAGYSLGGLFALYSGYKSDAFDGVISASGSLWYDGFCEFADKNPLSEKVKFVYLSLGDKESLTKNPKLKTVGENTEKIAAVLKNRGKNVFFEYNAGAHFTAENERVAKGIAKWLENRFSAEKARSGGLPEVERGEMTSFPDGK